MYRILRPGLGRRQRSHNAPLRESASAGKEQHQEVTEKQWRSEMVLPNGSTTWQSSQKMR